VEGVGGPGTVRIAPSGYFRIKRSCEFHRWGICDRPLSSDHVPIADHLQCAGKVQSFVREVFGTRSCFTGREECELSMAGMQVIELSDRQQTVSQCEPALQRICWMLSTVAGQVKPGILGNCVQNRPARCIIPDEMPR